jgi:hypothetical protein
MKRMRQLGGRGGCDEGDPGDLSRRARRGSGRWLVRMKEVRLQSTHSVSGESRRRGSERFPDVPRLLLTREESARALGMSLSHFQRHVQSQLRCVYSGQLRLYRPSDLERWAERACSSGQIGSH